MTQLRPPHGEVHVWLASTRVPDTPFLEGLLSSAERARAARFRQAADRVRYVASHAVLRRVLSAYVDVPPLALRFEHDARGKPQLASGEGRDLAFSLSHSGDCVLVAVGRNRQVGVDIEEIRVELDVGVLARSVLSPSEFRLLERTTNERRRLLFFQSWVRKEAVLKASGHGLALEPAQVAVLATTPEEAAQPPAVELAGTVWGVRDLALAGSYTAAVAAQGEDWVPRRFDYRWAETDPARVLEG